MVRDSITIWSIPCLWRVANHPHGLDPLVEIIMTPPTLNTRSKKCLTARHTLETNADRILIDYEHFFTLTNMMDDDSFVHLIQCETCLYDIQDLDPEDIDTRLRMKKKAAKKRWMQRMRRHAELEAAKVKLLRRELWIAHKKNRMETGEQGIIWWSWEYWDEGKGVKRLTVKKEEPVTPIWWGQDYKPSTLMLTYPSLTPTSRYQSMDPNDFVWSPVYRPSPL